MGSRADNHDGSCRLVLSGKHAGKWRVQFTILEETGRKRRISRIFPLKTEAKTFLQSLRRGERIAEAAKSREITLGEWFAWLAEHDWPETLASVTISQRQARFRKYARNHLGNVPLSKLDALQIRAFYRHLRDTGASESIVLAVKSDLVRAFNQAISPYRRVPAGLANPFQLSIAQPKSRDAVALSLEEARAAIVSPHLDTSQRAMLGLFVLAGLRLGEVMAITRSQIRLEENLIAVDRSVHVEYGGKQSVGLPKGGKTRCAVLCETLKSILEPHIQSLTPEQYLWSALGENKPKMKKRIYELWKSVVKEAGLPESMSPHDCRLTHINLIEKLMPRVSVTTLKEHVGHAATGVTEANYTRPITSAQEILREELDRCFGA